MGIVVESYMENLEGAEVGWSYGKQIGFEGVLLFSLFVVLSPPDQSVRNGDGSCITTEGAGIVGGSEGSRGAEFPPTPLSHHMMLKKAIPIDHPRTPSPPITISPSSPPHSQVHV